jgi:hypothetical protein
MRKISKSPARTETLRASAPTPSDPTPEGAHGDLPPPADQHGSWPDADQAAVAALDHINHFSVRDNVEYAGLVYRRRPHDFDFTGPVRGTAGTSSPYDAPAPHGSVIVGTYHTHGDYSILNPDGSFTRSSLRVEGDHECDRFAEGDYETHRRMGGTNQRYTSYLGTPSGAYLSWNPFRDPQTETIARRPRPIWRDAIKRWPT